MTKGASELTDLPVHMLFSPITSPRASMTASGLAAACFMCQPWSLRTSSRSTHMPLCSVELSTLTSSWALATACATVVGSPTSTSSPSAVLSPRFPSLESTASASRAKCAPAAQTRSGLMFGALIADRTGFTRQRSCFDVRPMALRKLRDTKSSENAMQI